MPLLRHLRFLRCYFSVRKIIGPFGYTSYLVTALLAADRADKEANQNWQNT